MWLFHHLFSVLNIDVDVVVVVISLNICIIPLEHLCSLMVCSKLSYLSFSGGWQAFIKHFLDLVQDTGMVTRMKTWPFTQECSLVGTQLHEQGVCCDAQSQ